MVTPKPREVDLIGREGELNRVRLFQERAISGKGSTILISGEAGIGKTRFLEEIRGHAASSQFKILYGAASSDTLRPFLVFSKAMEDDMGQRLFDDHEYASFTEIFSMDGSGSLIAKTKSDGAGLDADTVAAILSAVQSFVRDSFDMAGQNPSDLGRLEYGDMKILIERGKNLLVTAVLTGSEHPDMKASLKRILAEIEDSHGEMLGNRPGDMANAIAIQNCLSRLAETRFLVPRDLKGLNLESERTRIASGVLEFLTDLAKRIPVMLVLEDMHWADESSLFVLRYLARNLAGKRILILATLRPGEGEALGSTMDSMNAEGTFVEICLGKLEGNSIASFLNSLYSPNSFPPVLSEHIAERCQGNPFFMAEVLRQMVVDGSIERHNGMYSLVREDYSIPDTVEGMVRRRLEAFETDSIAMAEYCSCIGQHFETNAALSMPTLGESEAVLEKIQRARLILRHNGNAEFSHSIFRDVIYGDIAPRWKSAYHKSIGDYYESAYFGQENSVIYELAHHYSRSREHQKSYEYCRRAAEKAESSYATEQAIQFYDLMLSIIRYTKELDIKHKEIELLLKKGHLLKFAGEWEKAESIYKKCLTLSQERDIRKLVAEAQYSIGSLMIDMSQYKRAFEGAECALNIFREINDSDGKARSLSTMGSAHYHQGEYELALGFYTESKKLHISNNNREGNCYVEGNIGTLLYRQGKLDEALSKFEDMLDIAQSLRNKVLISRAIGNKGFVHYSKGNHAEAMDCYGKQLAMAEKMGDRIGMSRAINNMGIIHFSQRDNLNAMECYKRDLAISEELGDKRGISITLSNIGLVLENLGKYEEALEHHQRSIAMSKQIVGGGIDAARYHDYAVPI
ncbi:MAG: tetratricopeptide repeat protein, partial [Thermoplasmata archaeon]